MPEILALPHWTIGTPLPAVDDPRFGRALAEQLRATNENFESLVSQTTQQIRAARLLHPQMSDTASSTLTLTTSYQDVPGIEVTLPMAGTYLLLYVFDFAVEPAGVGQCLGVAKVGSTVLGNAATFQLGASGDVGVATIGNFHVAAGAGGDAVVMQARKTINAGTARVSNVNTRLAVFGPL